MDGVILVNKEANMSSHDVIYKLRRILKTKKIGHCGTLDPQATGVLVCLVNKATKLSNSLVLDTKEYVASFKLGLSTTTQDLEGEVVEKKTYLNEYSQQDILKVLKQFEGKIKQTPSIYSAIKVNGKKLYEYARLNQEVEIPVREIEIFNIELLDFVDDTISIKVNCGSGTYIRTLCFDIAAALGYPGVLTKLDRTKSGSFLIEDSYTLQQIENNEYQIIPINKVVDDYPKVILNDEIIVNVKHGKVLKIEQDAPFFVYDNNNEVVAIYEKSIDGIAKIKRGLF